MITTDNSQTLVNALAEIERLKAEAVAADIRITNDAALVDRLNSELETLSKIAGLASVERDAYKASAEEQVERVIEIAAERDAAQADAKRLEWLSRQTEAYGFEEHEGNGWRIAGPYATLREAIDEAMGEQS